MRTLEKLVLPRLLGALLLPPTLGLFGSCDKPAPVFGSLGSERPGGGDGALEPPADAAPADLPLGNPSPEEPSAEAGEEAPPADEVEPELLLRWRFDEEGGDDARDDAGVDAAIHGLGLERIDGPRGRALRLDGYSSSVQRSFDQQPLTGGFTVAGWLALPAYPVSNAPLLAQYRFPDAGFFFGVEPLGRWYLAVSVAGGWHTVFAPEPLPRDRWVHLAGSFDATAGELVLYLDGAEAARMPAPAQPLTPERQAPLALGADLQGPLVAGLFPTGMLSGAVDDVRLYQGALPPERIAGLAALEGDAPPPPCLLCTPARLTEDPHRPRWHPMPASSWTNEPHGLVWFDGRYHLFFQKNPNGPYWAQIHWGHLESEDLVSWRERPMPLAPAPGFDSEGIWSGGALVVGDRMHLLYTGVDGARARVGLAKGASGRAAGWTRHPDNPVIDGTPPGYHDFRDPYVLRHGDGWRLLIGTGIAGRGGTALVYSSDELERWELLGPAFVGDAATSGIFWEMPVIVPLGPERHALLITTVEDGAPARALYWVGRWDGARFEPEDPAPRPQELLPGLLSPTVGQAPDGRLLAIGIVPEARSSARQYEAGWAHAFGMPRELYDCGEAGLCQRPARELQALRGATAAEPPGAWRGLRPVAEGLDGASLELRAELELGDADEVSLLLRRSPNGAEETRVRFLRTGEVVLDRTRSSGDPETALDVQTGRLPMNLEGALRIHAFVDRSIVEVFVDDRLAFATRVYPIRNDSVTTALEAVGGEARLVSLEAYELRAE